jgi:nitrate reductase gamma subunit
MSISYDWTAMAEKFLFIVLPYLSAAIFLIGFLYRSWVWGKTPVPLRIVTTPAPRTRRGVVWRMVGDALWFPSLFKGDRFLWACGFSFHILLWLVLLRHLRYFLYPVPGWVEALQPPGLSAGYLIPIPLALLLARRLVDEKTLYVSILGDYFSIFLLLAITISGTLLGVFFRTYLVEAKAYVLDLIRFSPSVPQAHWLFGLHLFLVMILLIYFPFSKLMHSGGLFWSSTRNQRADFETRFVNPWDFPVAYNPQNLWPPEKYQQALMESKEGKKE